MKKTSSFYILLVTTTLLLVASCTGPVKFNKAAETEKILKLHHAQRGYHFNKDSLAFANQLSDNFMSVNRGVINKPERESTIARYNRYFSSVEFIKWDDVHEPIIKFSDDGSMAYTIVDKIVVLSFKDKNDSIVEETTHYAWTTIFKKYGEEWKIDMVTSTNKPEDIK